MSIHFDSGQQAGNAEEIIDNAIDLPLENQELLLMMAKAMQYTRTCVSRQKTARSPASAPETVSPGNGGRF
ncbi:MAG: hypothetical protein NC331_15885 [Lachnospiraceae bacterium]|nr:hypothetical protein [Lachnospiraceae bacterium]MCM1240750.1 hypothetical protein [Lachnospiraceae bacterium]MCM1240835.1 hypothetical protein [Lachnospiraceae bacterium]